MEDFKPIIAKNITALRQSQKMTQIELAEKLNYSDKAISKWERGESIPDIGVLKTIADLFGVTLDYLLEAEHQSPPFAVIELPHHSLRNQAVVTILSILTVWFLATLAYVVLDLIIPNTLGVWLTFVYAVPATMVVWLIFNTLWFNKRHNYCIISLLMWTGLVAIFLTALACHFVMWKMFLLGITGQIAILVWSRFQKKNGNIH